MPKSVKLAVWIVLGIGGLAIFILFFDHAQPVASIDINVSKREAIDISRDFITNRGFSLEGFSKAAIFSSDYSASAYLQKTQGIKRSNELIESGIPVWYWRVRWFKELKKQGFIVYVDPSKGKILYFYHSILDDAEGKNLSQRRAMAIAKKELTRQGIGISDYELKDSTIKKQKHRTDHYFVWEMKDYKIDEATLRLNVDIYGDELGTYRRYLKLPEGFGRQLRKETSFGRMLSMVSRLCIIFLTIAVVLLLIFKFRPTQLNWKLGLGAGGVVASLRIFNVINSMPLFWSFYPDTTAKSTFVMTTLGDRIMEAVLVGLLAFVYGTIGEFFSRSLPKSKIPLCDAVKNKTFPNSTMPIFIVGYSLGFVFLGYVTLFYLIGTKFFNIWMPPLTNYSNILGMTLPFLCPLTIAVSAAINEEFIFRLFSISFLKKYMPTACAIIFPALLWGFAHSTYPIFPVYARGIELTIFGACLGLVFLKYGIETVIIAHFVIDAVLVGLPLMRSGNFYLAMSGLAVVSLAFMPIIFVPVIFRGRLARKF